MSDTLEVLRSGPQVAEIWLNRPAVRNAFNGELIAALTAAFDSVSADERVRVVVLGARGKAFCAGADLAWMAELAGASAERNLADAQALADMLAAVDGCPVPVVGRIHGDCYAGGVGLAALCDIAVAVESAVFRLSEARLGLEPATISPYVVRAIGQRAAQRYFVTAEAFSALDAERIGLVHAISAAGDLDTQIADLDRRIASLVDAICGNGPQATRGCKQLVRAVAAVPIDASLRARTVERIAAVRAGAEGQEGIQAFLARRPPRWQLE